MEAPDRSPTAKSSGNKATSTMTARSYDCTYCKRGFTNAQALGGHMNIHRKDRKQDEFNAQNPHTYAHFPFEIPPEVDIRPQPRFPVLNRGIQVIGQASTSPTKLPLFSESPSWTREADCGPDGVDLELRLGLDRPGSSVMGRDNTRNFFDY